MQNQKWNWKDLWDDAAIFGNGISNDFSWVSGAWPFWWHHRGRDPDHGGSLWSGAGRLIHCHASRQFIGIRQIPNHLELCHWPLLDGWFHGSHDLEHLVPSIALRMGSESVQTSLANHNRIHWHDVQFSLLGSCLWQGKNLHFTTYSNAAHLRTYYVPISISVWSTKSFASIRSLFICVRPFKFLFGLLWMDPFLEVHGRLQHWMRPSISDPICWIFTYKTESQVRRPHGLFLGLWSVLGGLASSRDHDLGRMEVVIGLEFAAKPGLCHSGLYVASWICKVQCYFWSQWWGSGDAWKNCSG